METTLDNAADSTAAHLKDTADQVANTANEKINRARAATASGLASAAAGLHGRADGLASATHGAADKLDATADYVREHDAGAMYSDIKALIKRNPGPAMIGAAILGFLVARTLSRD
jgi:hypothetical protein